MAFIPLLALTASQAAAATLAASAASAGLGLVSQRQSVKAAQVAMDANARAAASSAAGQYRGLIVRQIREEAATAQELDRIEREAMQAESSAALAATEAGAGGGSLADQVRNFRASALSYRSAVQRNLGFARADTALTLDAVGQEAANRVSTFRPAYERPSLLAAGITLGKGFLDASRFSVPNRGATGGGY